MSEALECWACNSALEWDGDVPDDETDILCHACELDAKESEVARLTARVRKLEEALRFICDARACDETGASVTVSFLREQARAALEKKP